MNRSLEICLYVLILNVCLHADESWGSDLRFKFNPWAQHHEKKFGTRRLKTDDSIKLRFIDKENKRLLPCWIKQQGVALSQWAWLMPNEELNSIWLNEVLEVDLGYGYLRPDPLRVSRYGQKNHDVEVTRWNGDSWSPYRAGRYKFNVEWEMPSELNWLEAWQVSSGLASVVFPVEYLRSYPRSVYLSSSEGDWRGMSRCVHQFGSSFITIIEDGSDAQQESSVQVFDWESLVRRIKNVASKAVVAYGPFESRLIWNKKAIYPIIPMLLTSSRMDIVELEKPVSLADYRFLLELNHQLSNHVSSDGSVGDQPSRPDMSLKQNSEQTDLEILKAGNWMSGAGFSFDWSLMSCADGEKKEYRMGDFVPLELNPYQPLFKFSMHPNYSPIVSVDLYKGKELMLSATVPKNIAKGAFDLGRYYLKQGDAMTLIVHHKDGSVSSLNPIYAKAAEEVAKDRDGLVLLSIENALGMKVFDATGRNLDYELLNGNQVHLKVNWMESLRLQVDDEVRILKVWELWLNGVASKMSDEVSFVDQYHLFERAFPLKYDWSNPNETP